MAMTTLFGDGTPQTEIMCVNCGDDHPLINTEVHRQKFKNIENDAGVTVTIWDSRRPTVTSRHGVGRAKRGSAKH